MELDRRQLLAAGSAGLVACGARALPPAAERPARLDELFEAHAHGLPERAGAGANHYPMAAEALEALGREAAIERDWVEGAALYAGTPGRRGALGSERDAARALGDYERLGDWLDLFRRSLEHESWRAVVGHWVPVLAAGSCAAAFHGVIRSGHAVRALGRRDTPSRRSELAMGLAYWAARYVELPTRADGLTGHDLESTLATLEHPWLDERDDVPFHAVVERLTRRAVTAPVGAPSGGEARGELEAIVRVATEGFLEMLVLERHRLWMLHTVTGPAALDWLLPEVGAADARLLVEHARRAVVAMHVAYGEPYTPRAHVRRAPAPWPELVRRVVASRSVHGIKLLDALLRFDADGDPLWRSVAEQWLEWT